VTHAADEADRSRATARLPAPVARRRPFRRIPWPQGIRLRALGGWLFVVPALVMYGLFVLQPLVLTVQYSLYRWDGVGPATWVGLSNYAAVLSEPKLVETLFNAFRLVLFFSIIPVSLGLITASVISRIATGPFGTVSRTVLFLPQVIPLVAAGIIWGRILSLPGLVNQGLAAIGLDDVGRAWLGDFDTALPAVGVIGIWVLLGFCSVLLLTGIAKIDIALYESARLDGAGWFAEFREITVPSLRHEIGVCLTVTIVAALATFDIVYVSTGGGPGNATAVPGIQIYILAFLERQVGLASALAVVLILLVTIVILPIQRLGRSETP
jgi:raffinose/stachyose/melibiose transport system permease protein